MLIGKHYSVSEKNIADVTELAKEFGVAPSEIVRRALDFYAANSDKIYKIKNFKGRKQ